MHRTTGFLFKCHVFKGRKLAASICVKKGGEMAWFFVHFKVGYSGSCSFVIYDNVINHGRAVVESPLGCVHQVAHLTECHCPASRSSACLLRICQSSVLAQSGSP